MSIFWNLGWFFKRHWVRYFFCVICLVVLSLVELLPPWLVGQIVDKIQAASLTSDDIFSTVGLILVCGVLIYVLRNAWRILLFGGSMELGRVMRVRLFHHLSRMSPEFYQRHQTGDLMAHATNDIRALELTAAEGVLMLVDSLVAGTAVLIAMIWVCGWQMTAVALIPFPVMAWLMFRFAQLLHKRFRTAQEAFSDLNNRVQEAISGVRAVRAHNLTEAQKKKFSGQSEKTVDINMQVARIDALFDPVISICVGISMFGSLGFGGWRIYQGLMTVGELTSFTIYLGLLIWPMLAFGWLFNIVERGNASLGRLKKLMAIEPDVKDSAAENNATLDGNIEFISRGFAYPSASTRALEEFSFVVPKGSFVGLCGRTGSGKTSIFRLLLRQYDAEGIDVKIGSEAHDSVSLDALRGRFALVSQEPFLFSASISENIAFGRPDASQEDIERVAKLACIHDDIIGFPEGYKTMLGEKGVNMSGGQKQRLTIARALLMDADYLLLDDAFCSLDMQTEAHILDNLLNRENPCTVILITQRLTNLHKADQVVVLDSGRLSEVGDHDQLMAERGWYARIFERQAMETTAAVKLSA